MNGSHVAGAGFGAIVGAILVSLGTRIGLDLTGYDAATLGMAALAAGLAVGHAIGEVGVVGVARVLARGRPKAATLTVTAPVAPPPPVSAPPA